VHLAALVNDILSLARCQVAVERSRSVARAIYLRLPEDARLWVRGKEFVAPDAAVIGDALT
jgi:hypothetical protein